jgi:DmsE family decaheme c-type cytochrome
VKPEVAQVVDIQHTQVRRPKRMPMAVQEPDVCYQCHPKTQSQFALPSHHPVLEGKMVCSDCHDSHGQAEKNLREPTVNLVCFRCHAEKQGPFVWQHPPVEENCGICHNPHGTVANNLLHQPPTFLCLRCHSGHREFRRDPDRNVFIRQPFFTDCMNCHAQIHGSDLPAATLTPRLTR